MEEYLVGIRTGLRRAPFSGEFCSWPGNEPGGNLGKSLPVRRSTRGKGPRWERSCGLSQSRKGANVAKNKSSSN